MDKDINIKNLRLPYVEKNVNLCIKRELNYLKGNNGTGKTCKLRSNGMPVPLLRNGYSIFNGTKYR